jgi:hypothetical protein
MVAYGCLILTTYPVLCTVSDNLGSDTTFKHGNVKMARNSAESKKRKRAPRGGGRLFKKVGAKQVPADSPAKGNYYLTYTVNGKRITTALKDKNNAPITDRTQAENERKRIMAPYQTGDTVETLRAVQARITAAEGDHVKAQDEATPPLKIADAWQAFEAAPERPDSGKRTLADYAGYWQRFAKWIRTAHSEIIYMRDVKGTTVAEYAANLTKVDYPPTATTSTTAF